MADHILVWPNTIPFNAMLLTGKLPFKTRSQPPLNNYSGRVLFYNSTRNAKGRAILGAGIDPTLLVNKTIIGEGTLCDVRELTSKEKYLFARLCSGLYGAFPLGYFFENLYIYQQPIPANWPGGCVRGAWVRSDEYEPWRHRAIEGGLPADWRLPLQSRIWLSGTSRKLSIREIKRIEDRSVTI